VCAPHRGNSDHRLRGGGNHRLQLGRVAHLDDLPSILGHDPEDEAHLLLRQITTAQILLCQTAGEIGIHAREADAVVVAGQLRSLLVGGLVLLIDADQSLESPDLVGGEHLLDEGDGVLLVVLHGGDQYGNTVADHLKKSRKKIKKLRRMREKERRR